MMPRCTMSQRCWRRTVTELDRVSPREGIVVPLVALTMRRPDFNPCTGIELEEIDELVVASTVLVPADRQVNGPARVSVLASTNHQVNRSIQRIVTRFPRLRACAYLHSHPFARGGTWPSRGPGCDYDGHMIPLFERNREAGLNTSFSFIACRAGSGDGWVIAAFALDRWRRIVDLGFVEVADDSSASVRDALVESLHSRADVRSMLHRFKGELARRGLGFRIDELFGGWLRVVIDLGDSCAAVLLLPVEFPRRVPEFFTVRRPGNGASRFPAPAAWLTTSDGWVRVVDRIEEVYHVRP
ncbi:MAG: hypothetical protein HY815_29235 [Candidatus Riflebacteria bacterium]|nr:hypothetical protein [Candidatus Riflebacteria bacterium]